MKILPYIRKTQFYETDQMGIIHHSNYIRWFEEARVDYMTQVGFDYMRANTEGIDFAVLGVTCDYKSMVRFGEDVKIYLTISTLETMKMTLLYEVRDADTNILRAIGESRHCYYHNKKNRPVSLKKNYPIYTNYFLI